MKTATPTTATVPQIKKIHITLRQLDLTDFKEDYALTFSDNRTTHISELYVHEARQLIMMLCDTEKSDFEKSKRIVSNIWKLASEIGMIYGATEEDFLINKAILNKFGRERTAVKKNISQMDYSELKQVQRQFESIARKKPKK
jgi:GTP-sensing pleiotropic transcriptional regulator CodY